MARLPGLGAFSSCLFLVAVSGLRVLVSSTLTLVRLRCVITFFVLPRASRASGWRHAADNNLTALGYGKWKGGFPGGEAFFKQWLDEGMTGDVPDMPDELQSRTEFEAPEPKVDPREWYADMVPVPEGQTSKPKVSELLSAAGSAVESAVNDVAEAASESGAALAAVAGGDASGVKKAVKKVSKKVGAAAADESQGPDPALYEQYYPADKRYLAPNINVSEADNLVSMNMAPVESAFYERFYPKETLNKAPKIDIFYSGALNTASVSLKMEEVEGLPALAVVPKGDIQTSLVPSAGGGLKLDFSVSGGDQLNAYSDPRSVDKYNAMLRGAAAAAPAAPSAAPVKAGAKKVAAKAAAPAKKAGIKLPNPFAKK